MKSDIGRVVKEIIYRALGEKGAGDSVSPDSPVLEDIKSGIRAISLKHLPGQHNQKRHGWRYGNLDAIRRSMRRAELEERDVYRTRVEQSGNKPAGWAGKLERGTRPKPTYGGFVERMARDADDAIQLLKDAHKFYEPKIIAANLKINEARVEINRINYSKEVSDLTNQFNLLEKANAPLSDAAYKKVDSEYRTKAQELRATKPEKYIYTIDPKTGWLKLSAITPVGVRAAWTRKYNDLRKEWSRKLYEAREGAVTDEMRQIRQELKNIRKSANDNLAVAEKELQSLNDRKRDAFLAVLSVKDPASVTGKMGIRDKDKLDGAEKGLAVFNRLVSSSVASGNVDVSGKGRGRASFGYKMNFTSGSGTTTFVHEMGHWLEYTNRNVGASARQFRGIRTADDKGTVSLRLVTQNKGYDKSERALLDKFIEPYMGKVYNDGSTEIVSMGLQYFYSDPLKLAQQDPGYFSFIFNLVRGQY